MNCINARVTTAPSPHIYIDVRGVEARCAVADSDVKANIGVADGISSSVLYADSIAVNVAYSGSIKVRVATICDVSNDVVLRWEQDKLVWSGGENNRNVTKYNVLIASDEWKLEELMIEELL